MTLALDHSQLAALPLFSNLTVEQLDRIRPLLRQRTFPSRTSLITVEQPGDVIYIILKGTVKIHVEQRDGTDVTLAFGGPGDVEGEMSMINDQDRSANVVTQEETTVLWIERATFQRCLETMPALTYNLLSILACRLRNANERIQALCTLDIDGRVARQLMSFARQYGQKQPNGDLHVALRLTQSDIASCVGATRERVNQVMNTFKKLGFLSVDRGSHITIHNPQALRRRFE